MQKWAINIGLVLAYVGTIYAANRALAEYGFVAVGFGLTAPAGVYFAGLAFTLRDLTHERVGRWGVLVAILLGAAASYADSERFALASASAFLFSELVDWGVYDRLRERGWLRAVVVSNAFGLVVDSALFLWLAFGSLAFIEGQIVGKAYMTGVAVAVLFLLRHRQFIWERWCAVSERSGSA